MNTKHKTIFLVDDDATNLAVGSGVLDESYDTLTFNSGARLLKTLEKSIPDLILLDVAMPEMDGYEVIKILKSRTETANIPVVFLTAKNDVENEVEGLSLGALDYIYKPFSPPLLLKRIELILLFESQKREIAEFTDNLQQIVDAKTRMVVELQNAVLKTMAELVECRDTVTGAHIDRTQRYLRILLDEVLEQEVYKKETSSWDITLVLPSAQLHDVGKIAISDNILNKPGKLTDEEFEAIKSHPVFGKKVIERIEKSTADRRFLKYAKAFAISHHEKWDGSGYPDRLKEDEIPLQGRILAIVDVFDALVSERSYKKAFTHEEAVKIIVDGSGKHFDPALVDVFRRVEHEFKKSADIFRTEVRHNLLSHS